MILGHPFWGVWLSTGIMCATICWMLQAWVPPLWALMGGLLATVRLGTFSYWANSYWGGAVTALGGALVLGALPRIKRRHRMRNALLMGVGFALLFGSRPYESALFSVPVIIAIATWMRSGTKEKRGQTLLHVVVPLAVIMTATAGFLMYYCWRTTGKALVPPYIVNLRTYAVDPNFAWLPLRAVPQYHHDVIRRHWLGWDIDQYQTVRAHPLISTAVKILMLWFFYLGPLLSVPFLALGFVLPYGMSLRDLGARTQFLLVVCAANLLAILLAVPINPHYAAPTTGAVYALIVIAMERIRRWNKKTKRTGIFVVRAVLTAALGLFLLRISIPVLHLPINNPAQPWTWCSPWNQLLPRAQVESRLRALPGEHLVIVHYSPEHDPREGWISNSADIDNSKIVWAHDMGPDLNKELFQYFSGRQIWMVYPDRDPIELSPYEALNSTGQINKQESQPTARLDNRAGRVGRTQLNEKLQSSGSRIAAREAHQPPRCPVSDLASVSLVYRSGAGTCEA
ncbi:MAG: hypothetical protein JO159_10555 [Acidobacteria bacterium]|nr:hypothetical protein [Acidobacteriota bacterium]